MITQLVKFRFNGTRDEYEKVISEIEDSLSDQGLEFDAMAEAEEIIEDGLPF